MFGLFKKQTKVETEFHAVVCDCGNHLFRHVTPVMIKVQKSELGTTKSLYIDEYSLRFECIKCGTLYNRYGEKEEVK